MKKFYDELTTSAARDLRIAINERLKDLHPELVFKVKDIHQDGDNQLFVELRVKLTDDVEAVAKNRQLRVFEKVGEYTLVGWDPSYNPQKPYVVRKTDGTEYVFGPALAEKTFKVQKDRRK